MGQDKTFSFLSQASEDREETEIPHPIHPAWEERPWPSDVGESGFEFSFWLRERIREWGHSGVFEEVRYP
jgi:hypothetical protein